MPKYKIVDTVQDWTNRTVYFDTSYCEFESDEKAKQWCGKSLGDSIQLYRVIKEEELEEISE